ncbi:MAG: FtsB family cell division protein [Leptospirales bacterium]
MASPSKATPPVSGAPPSGGRALVWLLLLSGTAMVLYGTAALVSSDTGLLALIRYRWEARDLARDKEAMMKRIQHRKKEVDALRSDPFALERIAREREHRVRAGEIMVLPRSPGTP